MAPAVLTFDRAAPTLAHRSLARSEIFPVPEIEDSLAVGAVVRQLDPSRRLRAAGVQQGSQGGPHHRELPDRGGIIVMQVRAGQHFPAGTAQDGSLKSGRSHGSRKMRLTAALLTLACLVACDGVQTVSERSPARDDEWRQRQAELDAQAIMQGMAQARQRAEQLARTGR